MASSIDATKPTAGAALTADVRNNFSAAKTEIEALQADAAVHVSAADPHPGYALDADLTAGLATKLNLTGGTLSGWLKMAVGSGHYLYNLDTDASNYERLNISWASNALRINAEAAGTGAQRNIGLQTAGGYVGVGTASPQNPLDIRRSDNTILLAVRNAGTGRQVLQLGEGGGSGWGVIGGADYMDNLNRLDLTANNLFISATTYFNGGNATLGRNGDATSTASQKNSFAFSFQNSLWNGSVATAANGWQIQSIASETVNLASRLAFNSVQNGNAEMLTLLSGGNVGIATTSPAERLHVAGNVKATGYAELTEMTAPGAPATNDARLYLEDNGAGKTRLMARFATGAAVQVAIEP